MIASLSGDAADCSVHVCNVGDVRDVVNTLCIVGLLVPVPEGEVLSQGYIQSIRAVLPLLCLRTPSRRLVALALFVCRECVPWAQVCLHSIVPCGVCRVPCSMVQIGIRSYVSLFGLPLMFMPCPHVWRRNLPSDLIDIV